MLKEARPAAAVTGSERRTRLGAAHGGMHDRL
jgi:hypothetical protein